MLRVEECFLTGLNLLAFPINSREGGCANPSPREGIKGGDTRKIKKPDHFL
jgi:hypothetical protein